MSFGEVEHFATMLAGCESINSGVALDSNGRYAMGVLRLHANDLGLVAGQEGFLDAVKGAAANVKEWIMNLIKAIKNWFRSRRKPTAQELKDAKELAKFIKTQLDPDTVLTEQLRKTKHMVGEWLNYCDLSEERDNWNEVRKQFPKIDCVGTIRKKLDKLNTSLGHSNKQLDVILEEMQDIFIGSEKEVDDYASQVEHLIKRNKTEILEDDEKAILRTAGSTLNRISSVLHECQTYYERLKNAISAASKKTKE